MSSRPDDLMILQAQLAEKNELVAALTAQLERTATQLDRLSRAGGERLGSGAGSPAMPSAASQEVTGKLANALEEWQEFQPAERIERIESGIDQILELLKSSTAGIGSLSHPAPAVTQSLPADDFWAATKARLLGDAVNESSAAASIPHSKPDVSVAHTRADTHHETSSDTADTAGDPLNEIGTGPEPPAPIGDFDDPDELQAGVKTRDIYIQYLISRLRLAESKSYFPSSWDQLAAAPDRYRERLEALETVLKDHLRQSEVAHSLERALLARERAKLAQIKQNLEIQIKKMALPLTTPTPPQNSAPEPPLESKADQESRWKRIFSR